MYEYTFAAGNMLAEEETFVQKFLAMSTICRYPAGHMLIRQGERIERLYVALEGTIECSCYSENGQKKIFSLNRGRWFFGASALDGNRHTMNYQCLTPVTAAVMLPEKINQWDEQMLLSLARIQKNKERMFNRQLQSRAFQSVEERVLCLLRDLEHTDEESQQRITHQTIAEIVGATRVQVTNILKKYAEQGLISVAEDHSIVLTEKAGREHDERYSGHLPPWR